MKTASLLIFLLGSLIAQASVVSLTAGVHHTCALSDQGQVKCWGSNSRGGLGQGHHLPIGHILDFIGDALLPVDLGTGKKAIALAAGDGHTCALLEKGLVKCWGYNGEGQLGLGHREDMGNAPGEMGDKLPIVDLGQNQKAIAIAAGGEFTCALLENKKIKCWGANRWGQLGQGHVLNLGDDPNEMGDALSTVDLGSESQPLSLSLGSAQACALLENRKVKCWGFNANGRLGLGDRKNRGNLPGQMGDHLPFVDLGPETEVRGLFAGGGHSCVLLQNGSVKCWGTCTSGELGLGDSESQGDDPNEMGGFLPTVDLGTNERAVSLSATTFGTCALLENKRVKCWGYNHDGQLGLGDTLSRGDDEKEMGNKLNYVDLDFPARQVAAGEEHTCALLLNGGVKCWGQGTYGKLGQGYADVLGDEPGEMGKALFYTDLGTGFSRG